MARDFVGCFRGFEGSGEEFDGGVGFFPGERGVVEGGCGG